MKRERRILVLKMIQLAAEFDSSSMSHQRDLIDRAKQYGKHFQLSDSEIIEVLGMRVDVVFSEGTTSKHDDRDE